jgi:hypothetical protein
VFDVVCHCRQDPEHPFEVPCDTGNLKKIKKSNIISELNFGKDDYENISCSLAVHGRVGRNYFLHHQSRRVNETSSSKKQAENLP